MNLKAINSRGPELMGLRNFCGTHFQELQQVLTVKTREKRPILRADEGKMYSF